MRSYGEAEHQEDDKESQEGDGRRQELLAQKMARLLGRGGREEERKFLETLLEVRNDPSEVQRLARSRLAALGAPAPQQAESEDSDCDEPEHSEASIKVTLEGIAQGDSPVSPGLSDMSAWEARSGGFLSCCRGLATRSPSAIDNGEESFPARARALRTEGLTAFTQSDCLGTSAQVLQEGMTELSERGWPPVCAFMFDEAWVRPSRHWPETRCSQGFPHFLPSGCYALLVPCRGGLARRRSRAGAFRLCMGCGTPWQFPRREFRLAPPGLPFA